MVTIADSYGLFVGGDFVPASGPSFPTVNPATEEVLAEIGAQHVPEIIVINKADAADPETIARLQRREPHSIVVSAKTGAGIEQLLGMIEHDLPRSAAKAAKQDEFYTQYVDIQKEVEAYREFDPDTFRGKVVSCNCDDPFESNFFKYFAMNFNFLGLKKLIATSYSDSQVAFGQLPLFEIKNLKTRPSGEKPACKIEITEVPDENADGAGDLADVENLLKSRKNALTLLEGDGDFRSAECV